MNLAVRGRVSVISLVGFCGLSVMGKSTSNKSPGPEPKVTVKVFNFAQVPSETWNLAQKLAGRIFSRTGIDTVWLDCSLSSEGSYLLSGCDGPRCGPEILLRLVPTSPASISHFGDTTLGIAALGEEKTRASASVFYDRVKDLAGRGGASMEVILGCAVAHEIGHLLLGSNSHSRIGLMKARWNRQDLNQANGGELLFGQREAAIVRAEALRRGQAQNLVSE